MAQCKGSTFPAIEKRHSNRRGSSKEELKTTAGDGNKYSVWRGSRNHPISTNYCRAKWVAEVLPPLVGLDVGGERVETREERKIV